MLLLMKVLCILVSTTSLWVTLTPPQPPPAENEETEMTVLEAILRRRYILFTIKCSIVGFALAEMAVLIAQHALDHQHLYSRFVLSHLIFSNDAAERICVSRSFLIGTLMTSLGGFMRFKCYQAMGSMFTFEMSIRKNHKLVTSGPYAIVRHPGYTGVMLVVIGMLLVHFSKGSWLRESGILKTMEMETIMGVASTLIAIIIFGLFRRISKEDEALHQLTGEKWEDWAQRVPYKLVPLIY